MGDRTERKMEGKWKDWLWRGRLLGLVVVVEGLGSCAVLENLGGALFSM
jgi:hypothetical protein